MTIDPRPAGVPTSVRETNIPRAMLTLQILDAGETFFHPLDTPVATIGSAAGTDVRLREPGVGGEHARIEAIAGSTGEFKIVDLGCAGGTRVNGELVVQRRLVLGDRIEIAGAVLVVGQRIVRPATPAEVLEPSPIGSAAAELRQRQRHAAARLRNLAVGVVAIVVVVAGALLSRGADVEPHALSVVDELRASERFEEAQRLIEQVRRDWAGVDAARNARLDALAADVSGFADELAGERARVRSEARTRSRLEQFNELQAVRTAEVGSRRAEIAAIVLSELTELRLGVDTTAPAPVAASDNAGAAANVAAPRAAAPNARAPDAGAAPADPVAITDPAAVERPDPASADGARGGLGADTALLTGGAADEFVARQLATLGELRQRGEYALALEVGRETLASVAGDHAERVRPVLDELRAEVELQMRGVIDRARDRVATGRIEDVDAAIADLQAAVRRFPSDPRYRHLAEEQGDLERYRERLTSRPAEIELQRTAPVARLADLRDGLARAQRADRAGEFGEAARIYREVAERVRADDPLYAQSLEGRSVDLELCAELARFWTAHSSELGSFDAAHLSPASLAEPLLRAKAPPRVLAGAAVAAYRLGHVDAAESILARAVRADATLQELGNGVIARGRGELGDGLGYRLVDGRFVSVRALASKKRAAEIARDLPRIAAKPAAQRDAWVEETLARGPHELDALVTALGEYASEAADRLERDPFRRHWDKVAEARDALDRVRDHAKALIYDEVRYFYPYSPPAVSADKASEYQKVQSEVDARVAAVRELWNAKGPSKRAPAKLFEDVDRIDWAVGLLAGFGETVPGLRERLEWVRALPRDEPLELRTFCRDEAERERSDLHRRIERYNATLRGDLTRAEQSQVDITNTYRVMFGHRPLAVNRHLVEAARGHAEEMARLGYFSHFSPVPGRRSPHDRMKLAGYTGGIGENIARHGSAESAHLGWIHSSGHHRNLLHPSHSEFAVGNDGNLWVQNFGRADEYEADPAFRGVR